MSSIQVNFTINGRPISYATPPTRTLLNVLREDLHLMGVKDACGGEGECGACTVLMNDVPVNSCLVMIGQVDGSTIETIEGLSANGEPHPIQSAFVEAGAVQCGYCTPGAVMATKALLARKPNPNDEEIQDALAGNLCRCTGYTKMIAAVHLAAQELGHGS